MGAAGVKGARPPSHVAYYIALTGILALFLLLCCYAIYFFIKKIKELSATDLSSTTPISRTPAKSAYSIQPEVRDSATAMAKLCKLPPQCGGKGDTVFPTSTSPEAQQTITGHQYNTGHDKLTELNVVTEVTPCR